MENRNWRWFSFLLGSIIFFQNGRGFVNVINIHVSFIEINMNPHILEHTERIRIRFNAQRIKHFEKQRDKTKSTEDFQTVLLLFHIISEHIYCVLSVRRVWCSFHLCIVIDMTVNIHIHVCSVFIRNTFICEILFSFCHWFRFHCYRCSLVFVYYGFGWHRQTSDASFLFILFRLDWALSRMNEYLRFTMQDANQRFGKLIHHRNARYLIKKFLNEFNFFRIFWFNIFPELFPFYASPYSISIFMVVLRSTLSYRFHFCLLCLMRNSQTSNVYRGLYLFVWIQNCRFCFSM